MINSEKYWDDRFKSGSWDEFEGEKQTAFFTRLLIENLPLWIKEDIEINRLSLLDAGCAKGGGTFLLKKEFSRSNITGIDFSKSAIEFATNSYPTCIFECKDINKIDKKYDIVISSNVLEHFINPYEVMENMFKISKKYFILLLPFQEENLEKEHFTVFNYNAFRLEEAKFYLSYYKVIDTSKLENTMWPGKQIMLVYANSECLPKNIMTLSRMHNNDFEEKLEIQSKLLAQTINNRNIINKFELLDRTKTNLEETVENLELDKINLEETVENLELDKINLEMQLNNERNINLEKINQINELEAEIYYQNSQIDNYVEIIDTTKSITYNLNNTKLFKLIHLIYRIKYQLLKGNFNDRKEFFGWINKRRNKRVPILEHKYNPMFQIINNLNKINEIINDNWNQKSNSTKMEFDNNKADDYLKKLWREQEFIADKTLTQKELTRVKNLKNIIKKNEYKGVIIYPHIVNWEPLQTPQQLLREFAKKGYLCIFSENSNTGVQEEEVEQNIIITNDEIMINAIEDTPVVVLFTWVPMWPIVNKLKNKIIWYHILDQIDIFSGHCDEYERLHYELIENADLVSYVAHDIAKFTVNREDAVYLPNACNTKDFISNLNKDYTPKEMKSIIDKNKKIIGYYGYVAKWFNMEMIYELANRNEDWIFLIIGECIEDFSKYRHERIVMLGLKPYKDLADYAKFFDVAIIPFEISSMMDCVSPIKFFEYCTLGLPVVSSYMKEMEQFRNETVFVASSTDEFEFYINKSLDKSIKDLAQQNKEIANNNTWEKRVEFMEYQLQKSTKKNISLLLNKKYKKLDILFLSVIDYDFRYQRPQHLATSFAQNGHRVFYINANYNQEKTKTIKSVENMEIISIKSDRYPAIHIADYTKNSSDIILELEKIVRENAIRDCAIIVEYPTWISAAKYLKEKYGFRIITDYLDDYTGFEDTNIKCLSSCCYELLETSDRIVASSNYLAEIAKQYNKNVDIIRNGTEFSHFNKAYKLKMKNSNRKIIGYYGAIAHWFDFEKIVYVAKNLKDVDIVLIGEVTYKFDGFNEYSNIKLLGEKAYDTLPKYLEEFDVCVIPFDTSTDLIKATNPVKFYEYLSAAKKIVATEIPELLPFKDKYVYLSNENEQFLEYIKLCLDDKDTLANYTDCIEFAEKNDWSERGVAFIESVKSTFPMVSIVVLTYNQLNYTKECLESIISKTAYPNYEIIVVDNNSQDGTPEYLKKIEKQYENIQIILNSENYGFAKGNNIGIDKSQGQYIVLLNNDTVVTRGWITNFVKHFEKNSKLGILGPVTNSICNESKINVSYESISDMDVFAYEYTNEHMGETYDNVEVLAMFCLVISRDSFNKIGYLEELYGIGMFEDDDYSYKTKSLGYDILCAEDIFIHHYGNVSFKSLEDKEYLEIFNKNRRIFEERWNTQWQQHKCRPGVIG